MEVEEIIKSIREKRRIAPQENSRRICTTYGELICQSGIVEKLRNRKESRKSFVKTKAASAKRRIYEDISSSELEVEDQVCSSMPERKRKVASVKVAVKEGCFKKQTSSEKQPPMNMTAKPQNQGRKRH